MEKEQLKGFVVKKLFHHGYMGGRHTDIENLKKGLPGHFKGEIKAAIKALIKEEALIPKQRSSYSETNIVWVACFFEF